MTPKEFSVGLRDALRQGDTDPSPMALIPKNKRAFYEQVVVDFEATGYVHSPSGMTAAIVAKWLKANKRDFTITWDADSGCYTVRK